MSVPVRAGPSNWRRAATLVLAAGWTRPVPAAPSRPQPPAEGFRVLLLQRSASQGFLPGAHVFPGGVLEAADSSTDWLRLFAPHHWPPRLGLGPAPPQRAAFPVLPNARPGAVDEDAAALPDDIAFRICAIREAFEEAGVLLLRPRGPRPPDQAPGCALAPPPALADWRARVRRDPRHFLSLCAELDCTPDIWALRDWSGWITPFSRPGGRRFETTFFLCCLNEPPPVFPDLMEVVDCQWSSPSEAIESLISKEVLLAPPQFYEIRRLGNFASLSDLHKFSLDRESEGTERWMPIILFTADGTIHLLPGDEMYSEDSNFLENCMSTGKKTEEIMSEGKTFHRIVLYNSHNYGDYTGYSIHVTVLPKYKHVYPKSFVMDDEVDYQKLNSAMNDFYNSMCQDIEIKPLKLEEGQVCVVYCQELKCWCRAVIKSIVSSADHYLAECFLVDFARYIPVKSRNIRVAIETFMRLPYRAKKFRLYCTKPVTLHINFCEDSAEIVRAKKWDSAAIQYFQNILKATTQVEAKLCAVEEDTFEVYLYVTLKNEKVCVNDDLVAKNFACYVSPMEDKNFDSLEKPRLNIKSASFSNKLNPALTLWPMFLQGKDSQRMENKTVKCTMDSLKVSPKKESEKKQQYISLKDANKPLAVIVCPGWKKAQFIFELLGEYIASCRPLHPVLLTIGLHKDEAKNMKLPRGCNVVVTTPHSLLRLLQYQSLLFLRLCHLLLDEVEVLLSEANEQMFAILDNFKKNMEVEERESAPHQIVAVGVHWNRHIERLIKEFMNDPYIVITAMEEAALYGCVQQVVHLCLECEKTSTLLQTLDFIPSQAQKTLVFTCSAAETETVCKGSAEQGDKKTKSVLLLSERNACHAVGVLRYLERADAKIPSELYEFTAGVLEAKEDRKARRPLCPYLKAFGFCKDRRICPDRHRVNPEVDIPRKLSSQTLPVLGYIKIIPFYVLNATNYFGRIVDKHEDLCATLNAEMKEYFEDSSNKATVEKVEKFGLYGLAEKSVFHRVQVLEMSQKEDTWALDNVLVKFIDEGRTGLVTRDQLLHLPESFHTLPPQAVEFIVCRVKPADNEIEWNPKVTRYIHHKIIGKLHDAKVILALGNTVWIDPMVHITKLSTLKTSVIDYNVRAEILSMGMGIDNSEHVEQLKKLYKGAKMPSFEESLNQTLFHPQIKWFQKEDVVILKIKIRNVKDYKCKYFRDRVVFSAWVGEKFYLADLELQANIIKDDCKCIIKYDEPVITLAKEQRESWCGLLKQRNPNVAFDFDHWEDCDEDKEDSHFAKVVNSKNLSCSVAGLVETSDKSSDEDESESE
ncbi:hypothetical protein JEQ12_005166 [Ovis aries]|uniref:Putative ATP-dependent RNA helicase TDRD12 n=1 Tax=Ovis aries TaxID=9940 RepID=A0A836A5S2_SHEEP|nr:hypothetical protein JEQ12_005166 [Ovis aries]